MAQTATPEATAAATLPMKLQWLEHLATHPGITDGMLRTALRLARYADQHGRHAYPGPARIARETTAGWADMTPKQRENRTHVVERQLRALTAAGVIRKAAEGGIVGGRRVATVYALVEWWTGDPAVAGDSTVTGTGDPAVTQTGDRAAPPHLQSTPEEPPHDADATQWADHFEQTDPSRWDTAWSLAASRLSGKDVDAYLTDDRVWWRIHERLCAEALVIYDDTTRAAA